MRNLFKSAHKKYRKRLLLAAKEEHERQAAKIREKKFNFSVLWWKDEQQTLEFEEDEEYVEDNWDLKWK